MINVKDNNLHHILPEFGIDEVLQLVKKQKTKRDVKLGLWCAYQFRLMLFFFCCAEPFIRVSCHFHVCAEEV